MAFVKEIGGVEAREAEGGRTAVEAGLDTLKALVDVGVEVVPLPAD